MRSSAPLPLHHARKIRLAVEAVGFSAGATITHERRVLAHAGIADEKIAAVDGGPQPVIGRLFSRERTLHDLHFGEPPENHRADALIDLRRPQDDVHLGQILLDDAQRARRMADVADVDRVPRGMEQHGFAAAGRRRGGSPPAASGNGERRDEGADKRFAGRHGREAVRTQGLGGERHGSGFPERRRGGGFHAHAARGQVKSRVACRTAGRPRDRAGDAGGDGERASARGRSPGCSQEFRRILNAVLPARSVAGSAPTGPGSA
jgi:hypothetical protein